VSPETDYLRSIVRASRSSRNRPHATAREGTPPDTACPHSRNVSAHISRADSQPRTLDPSCYKLVQEPTIN